MASLQRYCTKLLIAQEENEVDIIKKMASEKNEVVMLAGGSFGDER